jgi:hypothetical protein
VAEKVSRSAGSVQLIVFLTAISKTLKREIYGLDKGLFLLGENKEAV